MGDRTVRAPLESVDPSVSVFQIVDAGTGVTHSSATLAKTTMDADKNGGTDTEGALRIAK